MTRGSVTVPVIWPKLELVIFVCGKAKFVLLKTLKTSQRNSTSARSPTLVRLPRLKSNRKRRGPKMIDCPRRPSSPGSGRVNSPSPLPPEQLPPRKADVQGSIQNTPPMISRRHVRPRIASLSVSCDRFTVLMSEMALRWKVPTPETKERGRPPRQLTMPPNCQPPKILPARLF